MENNKGQRVYKIIMLFILTVLVTFLVTSLTMYKKFNKQYSNNTNEVEVEASAQDTDLLATLAEFKTVLKNKYIGEIDEEKMIEGAIKGYVDGLGDQYTEYLTVDEMKDLDEETSGKYVGIGVYVANNVSDNTILVAGVMKNSPAQEAGMKPGDVIEKIDGVEFSGEQLKEATSVLKGEEENTPVKVTVLRENEEIELNITRRTITVEHVGSKKLENDIGYIQINSFDEQVAKRFEEEYKKLEEEQIKGLIVDLRSNGGGIVGEATDVADLFTEIGKTTLITRNKEEKEKETKAIRAKIIKDIPVVVLVDRATASASEILAGALRDNYGAKIVGEKTYGKGVIQTVYRLSDGSGLKITTEEYFTPSHTAINKSGIEPDIEIELNDDVTSSENDNQLKKAIETIETMR